MAERLPAAPWTQRADLAALVKALGAENMRWVGGAVRDTMLGHEVKDIDAATSLRPDSVMDRLRAAGIRVIPTGIDHGTVTAVLEGGPVEITTLRQDVSTDGRRATVEFASEWREDAARRDFTINALYAHPETLAIDDYFGGLDDLDQRRVRFIGDARQRILEDHLRILRYFRFQARFGAELDAEAEAACADLAMTLEDLSRERVAMELLGLLALPVPTATAARMKELGVLHVALPEAGPKAVERLGALVQAEEAQGIAPDPVRRMAALLPAVPDVAETAAMRLRLSNAQRERLRLVAAREPGDGAAAHRLAYYEGTQIAIDRLLLGGFDAREVAAWQPPELPIKGGEIVSRGVPPGPEIARILRAVEAQWIAEGFPDNSRVNALLDAELAQR